MSKLLAMLYVAYCRTFQAVMKLANYALPYRTPQIIAGENSIQQLENLLLSKGYTSFFLVSDPVIEQLGLAKDLYQTKLQVSSFSDVAPNPTSQNVEDGFAHYLPIKGAPIVAIGGGSAIDCAKAIAAKAVHPHKTVRQLQGILKIHRKTPLFIAIPTTAGTGSETTLAAVITDSNTHHKASITDPSIMPSVAVLNPKLTLGLPPHITATTGMDALCHAVEAYTNQTYNTPLENQMAKEAVQLIYQYLYQAYLHGDDLDVRAKMQRAAFCAGRAFTRGGVGYVHAVGHTLGGLYGVPHGLAMSIILPHVLRQYGRAVSSRLAELAKVCGMQGESEAALAENFIAWIEQMKEQMSIPRGVDMIQDKDVGQIIQWAMAEANPLYPTPVVWLKKDFEQLVQTLRRG